MEAAGPPQGKRGKRRKRPGKKQRDAQKRREVNSLLVERITHLPHNRVQPVMRPKRFTHLPRPSDAHTTLGQLLPVTPKRETECFPLEWCPDEVVLNIFSHLTYFEKLSAIALNRRFHHLMKEAIKREKWINLSLCTQSEQQLLFYLRQNRDYQGLVLDSIHHVELTQQVARLIMTRNTMDYYPKMPQQRVLTYLNISQMCVTSKALSDLHLPTLQHLAANDLYMPRALEHSDLVTVALFKAASNITKLELTWYPAHITPESIEFLSTRITHMDISHIHFRPTDELVECITKRIKKMQHFAMSSMPVRNPPLTTRSLQRLTAYKETLQYLQLECTFRYDQLQPMGHFERLTHLYLSQQMYLTKEVLSSIFLKGTFLEELSMPDCGLTTDKLTDIHLCTRLKVLNLTLNQIKEASWVTHMTAPITNLYLSDNIDLPKPSILKILRILTTLEYVEILNTRRDWNTKDKMQLVLDHPHIHFDIMPKYDDPYD